jgi:hypothetical protein
MCKTCLRAHLLRPGKAIIRPQTPQKASNTVWRQQQKILAQRICSVYLICTYCIVIYIINSLCPWSFVKYRRNRSRHNAPKMAGVARHHWLSKRLSWHVRWSLIFPPQEGPNNAWTVRRSYPGRIFAFIWSNQLLIRLTERARKLSGAGTSSSTSTLFYPPIHKYVLGQVRILLCAPQLFLVINVFPRCITGTPSTSFSRYEVNCLANCVERFLDTSLFMVKKIEEQRQAQNS